MPSSDKNIPKFGFLTSLVKISDEIVAHNKAVISVYLYGSNVESLKIDKQFKSNEIDILIVIKGTVDEGGIGIDQKFIKKIFDKFSLGHDLLVVKNGILPELTQNHMIVVDILGDGTNNIEIKDPVSMAMSLKPKLLLAGKDFYGNLSATDFAQINFVELANQVERYIRREFFVRNDEYAKYATAKSIIFLSSMIDIESAVTNNIDTICDILKNKHPNIYSNILFFLDLYKGSTTSDSSLLKRKFSDFISLYKNYQLIVTND